MLTYKEKDEWKIQEIVRGTADLRKSIVMYNVYDQGLSEFRVIAFNRISDLYVAKATGQEYPIECIEWVNFWDDPSTLGKNIQELFRTIDNWEWR